MSLNSQNENLNQEYNRMMGFTILFYLGLVALYLTCLAIIMEFECPPGSSFTALGWVEFIIWFVAAWYTSHAANNYQWPFSFFMKWEQSILQKRNDDDLIRAFNRGEQIIKGCQEVVIIDGQFVPKLGGIKLMGYEDNICQAVASPATSQVIYPAKYKLFYLAIALILAALIVVSYNTFHSTGNVASLPVDFDSGRHEMSLEDDRWFTTYIYPIRFAGGYWEWKSKNIDWHRLTTPFIGTWNDKYHLVLDRGGKIFVVGKDGHGQFEIKYNGDEWQWCADGDCSSLDEMYAENYNDTGRSQPQY